MSYHRVCCCTPGACVCTGCGFASSYVAGCSGISGNWLYNTKATSPCGYPCPAQEAGAIRDIDVQVSATIPSGTMTRSTSGGTCCYTYTGYATVSYTVTITDKGQCCFPGAAGNVCTQTNTFTGTAAVRFCHTVVPCCIEQVFCKFLHTTSLCPFYIGTGAFLDTVTLNDCDQVTGLDCENLPLSYRDVTLGCATWQSVSNHVALNTLSPENFTIRGFCPYGCSPNCGCTHCSTQFNAPGPFSLLWGSPPSECQNPTTLSPNPLGSWSNCAGDSSKETADCRDFDHDDQCCTREFHFSFTPPCYS